MHVRQRSKATHHQARADEEHETERDFRHYQRIAPQDELLLVAVFAPAFKTSLMSGREAFNAGSKLKTTAVKIETTTVKVNTGKSICTSWSRGSCPAP